MAKRVETIPTALGNVRKGLVEQGYTEDQAFWLVQDLVRGGHLASLIEG